MEHSFNFFIIIIIFLKYLFNFFLFYFYNLTKIYYEFTHPLNCFDHKFNLLFLKILLLNIIIKFQLNYLDQIIYSKMDLNKKKIIFFSI